ncbi:MAG: hypothetical protein KAT62_01465 [Desulfuromonadales bacterium]|nr:hypothetical protein [Desulfuromonadales bacterium]
MKDDLLLLLKKELQLIADADAVLSHSLRKCKEIGIKQDYTHDDLDRFEALTSRFARLSDILIQKTFRLIDEIDLESTGTVRDRINRAEKKGLIDSADIFVEIRMLRNDIAHEYLPEAIRDIYARVLDLTPSLLDCVKRVTEYGERVLQKVG